MKKNPRLITAAAIIIATLGLTACAKNGTRGNSANDNPPSSSSPSTSPSTGSSTSSSTTDSTKSTTPSSSSSTNPEPKR